MNGTDKMQGTVHGSANGTDKRQGPAQGSVNGTDKRQAEQGGANETDKKAACLIALAANYGRELPTSLFGIWLDLLDSYPAWQVEQAVKQVIRTYAYKTIPPFAILQKELDAIGGVIADDKLLALKAAAEWTKLLDDISKYGIYNEPEMHPTTAYVLRTMGGWEQACKWETNRIEWIRKDFISAWQLYYNHTGFMQSGARGLEIDGHGKALTMLEKITSKAIGIGVGIRTNSPTIYTYFYHAILKGVLIKYGKQLQAALANLANLKGYVVDASLLEFLA